MDVIDKNILDEALMLYKRKLFLELHQYNEEDNYRYGKETREVLAKIDNLRKRTWEGCL
jgi:hypothetical protein